MSPTTVTPMSISQLTPMISGGFPVTVTEAGSICWCELKMACCNPPLQTVFSGQRDGTCQHREGLYLYVSCLLRGSRPPSHNQTEAVAILSLLLL